MSEAKQQYQTEEAPCDGREIKHVSLDRAIESLGEPIARLNELTARINSESLENDVKTNELRGSPSFSQVLNEGPDRIRKSTAHLHELITQLEGLLF